MNLKIENIAHYLSHNQKQNLIENYNSSDELKEHEKDAFKQLEKIRTEKY